MMQHTPASYLVAGVEALVLRPSCSLDALPLAALQPLTSLHSLQLRCAFDQRSCHDLIDETHLFFSSTAH